MKKLFLILTVICLVLVPPVMAKDNPYKNAHKVTDVDIPVNIEADTVKLSDTSGVAFDGAGYTHTIGRISIRMKPLLKGLEGTTVFKGNKRTSGTGHLIQYELYRDLIKEQVTLKSPDTVSYSYDIRLSDWVTTEPDLSRPEVTMDANKTEIVSYPYTKQVTSYAKDSTSDIVLDQWGNIVVTVNGADVVVIPKPFAMDASGRRFELGFELDKAGKTITITGDLPSAQYPVTVDPTERVTNGGFESGSTAGWYTDSSPAPTLTIMSGGPAGSTYYCRYKGNLDIGIAGYSRIYQTIDYTGVTSASMAVRVFGYNIYDFVLSDGFWQDAAQGTTNYHINFPGQVATEWVTKSATPTLTGAHKIQFWTYGYNTAGIDSIRVMPDLVVPPVANFTATPTSGYAPLTVKFTDTSTGSPVTWLWSFGDGGTSTDKNPQHTYTNVGSYTVRLTVRNSDGSSTMEKTNFITVEMPAYSATLVGKYNPKDERMDRSAFRVWSQLNNLNSNRITRAFIHCNTDYPEFAIHCDGPVTKPDFGTSGGGLNNALLHYHTGHGEKVWWGLGGSRIILTDDFVYPTDVFGKWNNKNKWVVIDACEVLSDRSWGNALGTSHGVMGFETGKPMDDQLARFFIQNLNNGETVYNSYLIATRSAYRGDRDSEGYPINNDIRAIVIFKNVYQLSHDSLSSISPDAGPLDPVVIKCWHTKTGEVC